MEKNWKQPGPAAPRIGAVLLASRVGRRFGGNKLLEPVEGIAMYERAFQALPAGLFQRAAVVSTCPEILQAAARLGYLAIPNPQAAEGQSASLRLGLARLLDMDGVLFAVCDQPWLRRNSVERLLEEFAGHPDRICALSWQGQRGNPVIFPSALFPALMRLTGDRGGGVVIRNCPQLLRTVEAEDFRELRDVDSPEALGECGTLHRKV